MSSLNCFLLQIDYPAGPFRYSFTVEVKDHGDMVIIKVGSSKRSQHCVVLVFYKDNEYSSVLQDFVFDKACTEEKNLRRGAQGSVIMLQAAFFVLYRLYPKVRETELSDKSTIPDPSGFDAKLSNYYLLKHGVTWYQKFFDARPIDANDMNTLRNAQSRLSQIITLPYKEFLKMTRFKDSIPLKSVYDRHYGKRDWISFFATMCEYPQLNDFLLQRMDQIMRALNFPNLAASAWVIARPKVERLIGSSMIIRKFEKTNKRLGLDVNGGNRKVMYMHGGMISQRAWGR